jgi:serine/threonine protein kinase
MRDKIKKNLVCVKIIKIKNIPKKEREATKLEVDLLKRLRHPNIVSYVDSFLSKNHESLCICMEFCDGVKLLLLFIQILKITKNHEKYRVI